MDDNQFDDLEYAEKLSQVGNHIIENNLKKVMNPNDKSIQKEPVLCAQCMYDLYMIKGIVPQTKETKKNLVKFRSNSDTRSDRQLTNAEMQRKIKKDAIIAKHVGNNDLPRISKKSNLIATAQKTIGGFNFKPVTKPKLNMLQNRFSEINGSKSLIDQNYTVLSKTLMEVSFLENYGNLVSKIVVKRTS
jgi:hypothetical protein